MEEPRKISDRVQPLYELFDVLKDRFPQITTAHVHAGLPEIRLPSEPELYLHVSHLDGEQRRVIWIEDAESYFWDSGPSAGAEIGNGPEQVADAIARAFGVGA